MEPRSTPRSGDSLSPWVRCRVRRALWTCALALAAVPLMAPSGDSPTRPSYDCQPGYTLCREGDELRGYARGVALIDIDGDGDDDLWTNFDTEVAAHISGSRVATFHENDGSGHFTPIDVGLDPADFQGSWGSAFGDYDRDGDPDMMVTNGGYSISSTLVFYENRMNENGTFVDVTAASGVEAAAGAPSPWWGTSMADYDGDGWIDVVAVRRIGRPLLFHNNQDKTFTEVGVALGIDIPCSDCKSPVWTDYDADGDMDLYVAGRLDHGFYENRVNEGMGFVNVTETVMGPHVPTSYPEVFSALATDFDQDGLDDLWLGRWNDQDYALINQGDGSYARMGLAEGIDSETTETDTENTMGLGVGDFDDNGYPDIYIGTGMPAFTGEQIFFCTQPPVGGNPTWVRCTDLFLQGASETHLVRSHGFAMGDIDHDGDTDFVLNVGGAPIWDQIIGPPSDSRQRLGIFRRMTPPGNTATITLEGVVSNPDAIGARVRVDGSATRYYTARSSQGFQSQNSRALVVALGTLPEAPVEVRWPSGKVTRTTVATGERVHIVEGSPVPALALWPLLLTAAALVWRGRARIAR